MVPSRTSPTTSPTARKDKAVGDAVAERLQAIVRKHLEHSRVLVLGRPANTFRSDWAQLEAGTLRFRAPLNKKRPFVPLRFDDAPIKASLTQFLFINWLPADREQEYVRFLEACCPPAKSRTAPGSNCVGLPCNTVLFPVPSKVTRSSMRDHRGDDATAQEVEIYG